MTVEQPESFIYCEQCGKPWHSKCPGCGAELPRIRGRIPRHCHRCSKEYPWSDAVEAATAKASVLVPVERIRSTLSKFKDVVQVLERRGRLKPMADEIDVQDVVHAILRIDFDDIRREEPTPSLAGRSAKADFLLPAEDIVIEIKRTRDGLDAGKIGEELLVDIAKYAGMPGCKTLVCFVYDRDGKIVNRAGFIKGLEGQSTQKVHVVVIVV